MGRARPVLGVFLVADPVLDDTLMFVWLALFTFCRVAWVGGDILFGWDEWKSAFGLADDYDDEAEREIARRRRRRRRQVLRTEGRSINMAWEEWSWDEWWQDE